MRLPRAPGPARPRPGPGRRLAAVLAGAVVLAVARRPAVAAVAAHPAEAAAPDRPAAAVTLARATLTAETVPAATAAPARPATPAAEAISLPGLGGCGLLDFGCDVSNAITGWFAGLVKSAVNPLLALIGRTALSTPQPGSIAAVRTLWSTGLGIADACYGLLVLVGGIIVMTHETLQTSYSAKEIAPRIVIGFVTANLSMVLMTHAVDLANGLSAAFTAGGVNPQSAATSLMNTLSSAIANNGIFLILLSLAGVILALVLAAVYVIRLMAVVLLAAAAPCPARPVRAAADRLGRGLVVAGADRRPGDPGRPGPGDDRRRAGVLLPRLAARRRRPRADPDHLVPAVHPDADPVLDRAPRPFPVRPVPAAPRCPLRGHRRRLVPRRPAAARQRARQGREGGKGSGSGKSGWSGRPAKVTADEL